MNQQDRSIIVSITVVIVAVGTGLLAYWAMPPAGDSMKLAPVPSRAQSLQRELDGLGEQLDGYNVSFNTITRAGPRATMDKDAIVPLLRRALPLGEELAKLEPGHRDSAERPRFFLIILGDAQTIAETREMASGPSPDASFARAMLALCAYVVHESDAEVQIRAIDDYFAETKSMAGSIDPRLIDGACTFGRLISATPEVRRHAINAITEHFPEPARSAVLEQVKPLPRAAAEN